MREEDANPCEDGHEVMVNECLALSGDEGRAPYKDPHKLEQRFHSLLKEKQTIKKSRIQLKEKALVHSGWIVEGSAVLHDWPICS
jgi:hypothetical protein